MLIIPAIDLYQGKVVRFTKGDPSTAKIYSDDPLTVAKRWQDEGAKLIHLVDLSSAIGEGSNFKIIKNILKEIKIEIEVGGGIRDSNKAEELINLGAARVIIGTKSLDKEFLDSLINSLEKDKIAVSVDVAESFLAVEGWQKRTKLKGLDFINNLKDKGIKWVIYTDISRDGMLCGPNLGEAKKLAIFKGINFILSGGISSIEDLKKIKEEIPFTWGVISGKALYEEKINLKEALTL